MLHIVRTDLYINSLYKNNTVIVNINMIKPLKFSHIIKIQILKQYSPQLAKFIDT